MYAAFSVYPDEAAVAARAALPSLTRGGGGGGESRVFFFRVFIYRGEVSNDIRIRMLISLLFEGVR